MKLFTSLILLLFTFPLWAQVEILRSGILDASEYQMAFGDQPRPKRLIFPTFFVYQRANWDSEVLLEMTRRADFLLQQCGVGLGTVTYVELSAPNGDFISEGSGAEVEKRLRNIPEIETYPRPHVLFGDDTIFKVNKWGGVAFTLEDKAAYTEEQLANHLWLGAIFMPNDNHFILRRSGTMAKIDHWFKRLLSQKTSHPQNNFNTLAHELVHSVAGVGHVDLGDSLMSRMSSRGGYITDEHCRRLATSVLVHPGRAFSKEALDRR